jgi:cyclopropane fatty-acyl-phospholipid synthase-like methyltransferase
MKIQTKIAAQFKQPSGFLGKVISYIMKMENGPVYDIIIERLEIKRGDKLFEIGYGHGLGIQKILSRYDCTIAGIDFSELMVKEATKRNKKSIDTKKVSLLYGDFLGKNSILEKYDKVFCLNVIYFWNELEKPFLIIKSILHPKGSLCMFMEHRDRLSRLNFANDTVFNKYTIEQVVKALNAAGFNKVDYTLDKGYFITAGFVN